MKKLLILFMVGCFILSGFGAGASIIKKEKADFNSWEVINGNNLRDDDEIDQSQTEMNWELVPIGDFPLPGGINYTVAQSFKPQLGVLTRVEILIGKNSTTTHPFTIAIREELTGEDLTKISVDASEVPTEDFGWVEFDFENVVVTANQTYWIVAYTTNVTDNWYVWGSNISNPYPHGLASGSTDDGQTWVDEPDLDTCFITYGMEKTELEIEITKSFTGSTITITNVGDITANDVNWKVTVTGGILGMINASTSGEIDEILSGESLVITEMVFLFFGLGPVQIETSAYASNADEVSDSISGFMLLFFLL